MRFFDKRIFLHFDYLLILLILPLILVSHSLIFEINENLANKQLIYLLIAIFVFVFIFFLPIRKNYRLIPFVYWLGILLLIFVDFYGVSKLGARRWIEIPFVNLTFQPSEIIKPMMILMLGYLVSQNPPKKGGYGLAKFAYFSIYILLPFILVAKEPDLGTALILLFVGYAILFIIGVNWKIWLGIVLALALASPIIYAYGIKDYQKKRIVNFVSRKPSYHVQQSIIAIGSGGIDGKDKKDATQTQLKFLPIATSDFIFSYFVERYGFLGSLALIVLYLLIVLHLLSFIFSHKEDYMISVVSLSIGFMVFFNTSINILMVIGFAPVVGIPLPFVSYGGSAFLDFIAMFAILENLVAFRFKDSYAFKRKM